VPRTAPVPARHPTSILVCSSDHVTPVPAVATAR
jgi:hypothetical protein